MVGADKWQLKICTSDADASAEWRKRCYIHRKMKQEES